MTATQIVRPEKKSVYVLATHRVTLTGAGNGSGAPIWNLVIRVSSKALWGLGPPVQKTSRVQL